MRCRFQILTTLFLAIFLLLSRAEANLLEEWNKKRTSLENQGFSFEAQYTGDFLVNTKGGLREDETYLGNLNFFLNMDFERSGLWKNGLLFANILDNHGDKKISESMVREIQTVSNIEAPRVTRLYELWYQHTFADKSTSFLAGIHNLNSDFNVTEFGGLFLNSYFGITPEMAIGARPGIFPLASPGARLKSGLNNRWELLLGVYDGDPGDPESSKHLPCSTLSSRDGALIAFELAYHLNARAKSLSEFIKWGIWHNTGEFDDITKLDPLGNPVRRQGNYGTYIVFDKVIFQNDIQVLGTFLQSGFTPENLNEINYYIGGGLILQSPISLRPKDSIGLAVAHVGISTDVIDMGNRAESETIIEWTYNAQIYEYFRMQPNIQYVINPGADINLNNALVTGIRFEILL